MTDDSPIRIAAFDFLGKQACLYGEVLPYSILHRGFEFQGTRVPLLGPQGIFKPAELPEIPLSIRTAPLIPGKPRPYDDELGEEGLIRYRYRGEDPDHHENVGLRLACKRRVPLIYSGTLRDLPPPPRGASRRGPHPSGQGPARRTSHQQWSLREVRRRATFPSPRTSPSRPRRSSCFGST